MNMNGEDYDYKDYNGGDGQTGGGQKPPAPAPPAPVAPVVTTTVNPVNQRCPQNSGVNDRIRNAALEGHNYRRFRPILLCSTFSIVHILNLVNKATSVSTICNDAIKVETCSRTGYEQEGQKPPEGAKYAETVCPGQPHPGEIADWTTRLETSERDSSPYSTDHSQLTPPILHCHERGPYFCCIILLYSVREIFVQAMKYWWSQLRVVGTVGTGVTFRSSQSGSPISYFTRMAWATTAKIGCAVTQKNKCPNSYYIACHYQTGYYSSFFLSPSYMISQMSIFRGNVPDAKIYTPGNACSQCPGGYRCDSNKLCARS
ncbi:hypothetical protein COOONC_10726 [Cooperia oncophora]